MTPDASAKEQLESSDMILYIGPLPSDSATGGFSYGLPAKAKITLHSDFVSIGDEKWEGLHFVPILKKLVAQLRWNPPDLTLAKPKAAVNVFVP
jgi:pyruvate decarboxylase